MSHTTCVKNAGIDSKQPPDELATVGSRSGSSPRQLQLGRPSLGALSWHVDLEVVPGSLLSWMRYWYLIHASTEARLGSIVVSDWPSRNGALDLLHRHVAVAMVVLDSDKVG